MAGVFGALALLSLLGWTVRRIGAYADREEAQRNLIRLIVEQADDRAILDNLDV